MFTTDERTLEANVHTFYFFQAKVMARNKFGWSDFSQVLSFTTNYIISGYQS